MNKNQQRKVHELKVYFKTEEDTVEDIVSWFFVLRPTIEVIKAVSREEGELTLSEESVENVSEKIRNWIFKHAKSAFSSAHMWELVVPFDEEDKKYIKQQYILEEL